MADKPLSVSVSKKIGIAILVLTVISLAVNIWAVVAFYNSFSQVLDQFINTNLNF